MNADKGKGGLSTLHFAAVIFECSFPQDAGSVGLGGDEWDAGEGEVVEGGDAVLLGDLAEPHVPRVGPAGDLVLCFRGDKLSRKRPNMVVRLMRDKMLPRLVFNQLIPFSTNATSSLDSGYQRVIPFCEHRSAFSAIGAAPAPVSSSKQLSPKRFWPLGHVAT